MSRARLVLARRCSCIDRQRAQRVAVGWASQRRRLGGGLRAEQGFQAAAQAALLGGASCSGHSAFSDVLRLGGLLALALAAQHFAGQAEVGDAPREAWS